MSTSPFDDWDGSVRHAKRLQGELAARVLLVDDFAPLKVVAGVDVGFEEGGQITRAAAVLLDADDYRLLGQVVARVPTSMPYVPGLLSFRELPALLKALAGLPLRPDLVFCDGQGIAHPRRLGIASHLGVVTGLPTIGVAKKVLVGHHEEPGLRRGDHVPLEHDGEQIGWMLRSRDRVAPLVVSPGHRVSMSSALELVLRGCRGYRLPSRPGLRIGWHPGGATCPLLERTRCRGCSTRSGSGVRLAAMNLGYPLQYGVGQLQLAAGEVAFQLFEVGRADDVAGDERLGGDKGEGHLRRVQPVLTGQGDIVRAGRLRLRVGVAGEAAEPGDARLGRLCAVLVLAGEHAEGQG